jgi:hypothetical protein
MSVVYDTLRIVLTKIRRLLRFVDKDVEYSSRDNNATSSLELGVVMHDDDHPMIRNMGVDFLI